MTDAAAAIPRERLWWLALLMNLVFPPAGYAYVGAWWTVAGFAAVVLFGAAGLTEWTVAYPPGMYALGLPGIVVAILCLAVITSVHAAWLAVGRRPRSVPQLVDAAGYLGAGVAVAGAMLLFRAYWPHAFYSYGSDAMAPSLRQGDIVAVRGARALCGGVQPRPGDVALYRRPGRSGREMLRVVAGPGQTVALQGGRLLLDGHAAPHRVVSRQVVDFLPRPAAVIEETLPDGARYQTLDFGPNGELDDRAALRVPAGAWFILGDSRDNAADSRIHGPVAERDVCGIALRIVASEDKSRVGKQP
ncbi:signal peptidase I [Phenylobacterium sp.]|uniref:signal peptidase I n=1 Tax=Phenylobacterium sp. TaxID=1871053 RepID=UPI0025E79428|nr:signal peptidase I [Phenylobacterium sp.]